jgi:hypothetical protein
LTVSSQTFPGRWVIAAERAFGSLPNARAVELASQTDGVSTFKCATCGNIWTTLRAPQPSP